MKKIFVCIFYSIVGASASADLMITNGDFETGAPTSGSNDVDVAGWFDSTNHTGSNWWEDTWHSNLNLPDFATDGIGSAVGFSQFSSGVGDWLYQSIGTRVTDHKVLKLSFDVISFVDAGGPRQGELTVEIYQGDFAGAGDGVNIATAGLDLIGSSSTDNLSLVAGEIQSLQESIDITSANTSDEMWARIVWEGTWMAADNFVIAPIPEPSSFAAVSSVFGIAFLRYRRRRSRESSRI